jgi:spoIIIJ-associated protein
MRTVETTAKTVEEAIEIGLKELGAERGEVEVAVVSRGKTGILGLGSEPARVRVTLLDKPPDVVKVATDVLESLISKMGVSVKANLKEADRDEVGGPVFELEGEDAGLLIGRRGETLRAMQFLVKLAVSRRLETRVNLMLDIEGYQERRYKALTNMAQRVAQRVATSGRSIALEPMPANERRVIHMALADHPSVTTESTGFGEGRQVVVRLKQQG